MFTGIIQSVGKVAALNEKGGDKVLDVQTGSMSLDDVDLGDSIAVNGVCLTVIAMDGNTFSADVSSETLRHTTLGGLAIGSLVNLEKAITANTRLGGHFVSGHVDGVASIIERREDARSVFFRVSVPDHLAKYIAKKGSVCVNGISLTVNDVAGNEFDLNIVPHTLDVTTMNDFQLGTKVNIEVDIIARYLERLLLGDNAAERSGSPITMEMIAKSGFSTD